MVNDGGVKGEWRRETGALGQAMTEFVVMLAALTAVGALIGYIFLGSNNQGGGARNMPENAATKIEADRD